MIRLNAGDSRGCCDRLSRRSFLQLGAAGLTSLGLPQLFQAREAAAKAGAAAKDTRVILLWLEGGPSHIDLWDMKPSAPAEYRGYWRPIPTNVAGMQITEMFPRQAKLADKFSIVRTLHHNDTDHIGSPHIMLTSRVGPTVADQAPTAPSMGSIVARTVGARRAGLPPYVVVPQVGGGRYLGAHYLGHAYDPFDVGSDPNNRNFKVQNLTLSTGMSIARLDDRRGLRRSLDSLRRDADDSGAFDAMDKFEKQAFELVTSQNVSRAFDLASESDGTRDRYGRTTWGQSTLLARRMVDAGVSFVTVNMGGWDQHGDIKAKMELYLPNVDRAVSALFQDLSAGGLYEQTLVVVAGEFGRTPRMNPGFQGQPPGRDHWNTAFSLVMGGGGIKGGRIVGRTDDKAESIVERPVTPEQLHATVYHALGIDPSIQFIDRAGRPIPAVDGNDPIRELL
jgi:uncharacterized protein (DUF1501 family)